MALRNASVAQLGDVERAAREYLGIEVEAISRDELLKRLGRGDIVLIDVRPLEEYEAGHIEGALSIPYDELRGRLAELPAGREVIAYCRGPFCAYAHDVKDTNATAQDSPTPARTATGDAPCSIRQLIRSCAEREALRPTLNDWRPLCPR